MLCAVRPLRRTAIVQTSWYRNNNMGDRSGLNCTKSDQSDCSSQEDSSEGSSPRDNMSTSSTHYYSDREGEKSGFGNDNSESVNEDRRIQEGEHQRIRTPSLSDDDDESFGESCGPLVMCRYNPTHIIYEIDIDSHERSCEDRALLERYGGKTSGASTAATSISSAVVNSVTVSPHASSSVARKSAKHREEFAIDSRGVFCCRSEMLGNTAAYFETEQVISSSPVAKALRTDYTVCRLYQQPCLHNTQVSLRPERYTIVVEDKPERPVCEAEHMTHFLSHGYQVITHIMTYAGLMTVAETPTMPFNSSEDHC
uniref:CHHC U11-48K-type domain-containing protein n=1 Tax=Angiostrongylus cantonensis TaxID=6313 RepID=A0A158PCS9_ANGCA